MRPVCGPVSRRGGPKQGRFKHKLPKGIYMNYDDLVAMGSGPQITNNSENSNGNNTNCTSQNPNLNRGEMMLKAMDREIVSLKRQVSLFYRGCKPVCLYMVNSHRRKNHSVR